MRDSLKPAGSAAALPRWRGFNLLEKFIASRENAPFREADFEWMAKWGFDFVRLPLSYWCWSDPHDWRVLREDTLAEIDDAVVSGRRFGIHVCLNFHRAPGYTVDLSAPEPFNLWTDDEALEACAYHWRHFARRYADVPSSDLSFNLLNEPGMESPPAGAAVDEVAYLRVVKALAKAIRDESPDRLIIADGLLWGRVPVPALAGLGVAQSTRGYEPMPLTHWKAEWVPDSGAWSEPTWPLTVTPDEPAADGMLVPSFREMFRQNSLISGEATERDVTGVWDRDRLDRQFIRAWQELERLGVGVHVGEFGAFHHTPHDVTLRWMRDVLDLWNGAGWGWALWNFRGPFGILDSERTDVTYEDFHGHQLDRAMLELLQAS